MRTEAIEPDRGAEDRGYTSHEDLQSDKADAGGPPLRTTGFEDSAGSISRKRRKSKFWVLLIMAAIPTLFVVLLTFLMKYYEFPEQVMGVLFLAVVIPAALICEKLGFGEFSIFGPSTIPDWLLYSVMILLVYLYSLVLLASGRGVVWLVGRALLKVRGEKPALSKPLARRMGD